MTTRLEKSLAALPARQLNLLAIGTVLIAAALAWTLGVRAPLANLRLQQARLAALAPAGSAMGNGAAPAATRADPPPVPPAPTPLALIAAVSAAAQETGVAVGGAVPGPERKVAGLRQQTLDVEASGAYADLLAWIAAIEARQPAVGLLHLEMRAAPDGDRRVVRLQLGVYSKETPA